MRINQMYCCAFNEISNLSFSGLPREAMREFCRLESDEEYRHNGYIRRLNLGAFYVFTAVIKITDKPNNRPIYAPRAYGQEFADYIKQEKLGKVTMTTVRLNRKNVPTHQVRGWVWAPSLKAMTAWWGKNNGRNA